ncbi:MAG: acyl--CoA ligase [Bdellovibrionales bacterium]|nr:acyl--CoA ligase [Bdellovibrionales bacterium]
MILMQHLLSVAASGANDPAILFLGKKITYRELIQEVARLSYLYQHEIGHAPRMALLTTAHPSVIKTAIALSNVQGVTIPLDPGATDEELAGWIRASGATHLGITSDLVTRAREMQSHGRLYLPVIEIDKKRGGEYDSSFTPQPGFEPKEQDPVMLLRTAGNVHEPMLVALSHRELQFGATCLRSRYHSRKSDRVLSLLPWAHPFSLFHGMLFPLMTGATLVVDEGRETVEFLDFLRDNVVTRLIASPKICRQLLVVMKNEQVRLPQCVRSVTVGTGALSLQLRKAFALMEVPVLTVYGQAENGWTIMMEDSEEVAKAIESPPLSPAYRPLPGLQYKVLDQSGDAIDGKDERLGHLAVTGPTVFLHYSGPEAAKKDLEDATREVKRGTWLYTGDLFRLKGEGDELEGQFMAREVDAYLHEGEYAFADATDSVIQKIVGVEEAAAFFMKNAMGKTILACAVVKIPKVTLSDQEVIQACRAALEEVSVPRVVFFTDALPREASGAINRFRLQRIYAGTLTG